MRQLLVALTLFAVPTLADDLPLGKPVADFRLPDMASGKEVRLADLRGKIVVTIFYSHTCTFCRNYEARFRQLAAAHAGKVVFLALDSTDNTAAAAATAWKTKNLGFALLKDDRAQVAATLRATAMTTVCVIDARGNLRYHGAFDDCESGKNVRTHFVADALAALLADKPVPVAQTDVYGCLIP